MVDSALLQFQLSWGVLAQNAEPLIRRLEPATRVKVLAALAAFIILGVAMMLLTWLGARATRRYMRQGKTDGSSTDVNHDDWSKKPLRPE
jgi:hypothetical protein